MPLTAEDDAAGREVRPRHDADQVVDRQRRIFDQRHAGIDHLAEIVRRDVGRHADRDAARAVDQQVREARREDERLFLGAVVVRLEVDRVLVDVLEQRFRRLGHACFRCTASRRADRRRSNRNCPARRSAARASRNLAPCAPARRRSTGRRAGDTCRSRRRRCAPTSRASCRPCAPARASNRGCAGAPA